MSVSVFFRLEMGFTLFILDVIRVIVIIFVVLLRGILFILCVTQTKRGLLLIDNVKEMVNFYHQEALL